MKDKDKKLIIRKNGGFYHCYDDDAIIIWYLFGYKIVNRRSGFPASVFEKVKNTLEEKSIHYKAIISDEEEENYVKRINQYVKVLGNAKRALEKNKKIEVLSKKIESLNEFQLDKIIAFIEEVVNE